MTASCVRPVRELKGIQKIEIEPGEEKEVFFEIREDMLRFYGANNTYDSESGEFIVWIGEDSRTDNGARFILKG